MADSDVPRALGLADCTAEFADQIGGKAVGLGHLTRLGHQVPPGFVLTASAYRECVGPELRRKVGDIAAAANDPAEQRAAFESIRELFTDDLLTSGVADEINQHYAALGDNVPVAVRSSATGEDTEGTSFAGQQDTYLWIRGADEVRRHVVSCWASLFNSQAISYRKRFEGDNFEAGLDGMAMSVVVQRMVDAEAAGVLMTLEPVTGDRAMVYVEAAYGLGEGVVKGDTGSDSWWVDRATMAPAHREIREKATAHRFDETAGGVRVVDVPGVDREQPTLTDDEVTAISRLGADVEAQLGCPQDIEWAIVAGAHGKREIYLLQARPETVWSRREAPTVQEEPWANSDEVNVLHGQAATHDGTIWTTTNLQESIPGVATPMTWSIFVPAGDHSLRSAFRQIGALSEAEAQTPSDPKQWITGSFYGRAAMRVDLLAHWADRVPGARGEDIVTQFFSTVPGSLRSKPDYRHYPRVVPFMAVPFFALPKKLAAQRAAAEQLWHRGRQQLPTADRSTTLRLLDEAIASFQYSLDLQTRIAFTGVQTAGDLLGKLTANTAVSAHQLMAGYGGHEETQLVGDMWACSRDRMTVDELIDRHGYHGWQEGELSNLTWREDPTPVHRQVESYRARPDSEDPVRAETERVRNRIRLERELLASLPTYRRPAARAVLKLAAFYLPKRGTCKVAYLLGLDVVRSAIRRIGEFLVEQDHLDDAGDVFYLTVQEIHGTPPPDARNLVAERRAIRARYQHFDLPNAWQGLPDPVTPEVDDSGDAITGTPASPGLVEGPARVVTDPSHATVEKGEILFARDTDPSWASLLFLSSALVADIGGVMSHTAVVARELGIPCVVNTKTATRAIRTGDRVRVDGARGRIEILERAEQT